LLTLILLSLIFLKLDFESIHPILSNLRWELAFLPILVLAAQMVLGMLRWWVVLRDRGISVPWSEISTYYLASIAAGVLLPTQLGGESVRMYHLYKGRNAGVNAFSTIIYERSIGLGTLTVIGAVAALFAVGQVEPLVFWLAVGMFAAATLGVYVAVFAPFTPRLVERLSRRWPDGYLARLWSLLRSLGEFRSAGLLTKTFIISLLYQGTNILLVYVNSRVLGLSLPVRYFLVLVPLIGVLVMLPISVAGLGLREYLYIAFFGSVGLTSEVGFSLSILVFLETLLIALPGALLLLRPVNRTSGDSQPTPAVAESVQDSA
jgi:uncharacterized protein (TIRG00374 family)